MSKSYQVLWRHLLTDGSSAYSPYCFTRFLFYNRCNRFWAEYSMPSCCHSKIELFTRWIPVLQALDSHKHTISCCIGRLLFRTSLNIVGVFWPSLVGRIVSNSKISSHQKQQYK